MRDSKGRFADSRGKENTNYRHGMYGTPAYRVWHNMLQRCTNPNNKSFKNYGGRGVSVCKRWRTFTNFYADVGDPPVGMLIERIDNARGYKPGNCIWSTRLAQNRNRRSSKLTAADAQMIRSSPARGVDLARQYGVSRSMITAIRKRRTWVN